MDMWSSAGWWTSCQEDGLMVEKINEWMVRLGDY